MATAGISAKRDIRRFWSSQQDTTSRARAPTSWLEAPKAGQIFRHWSVSASKVLAATTTRVGSQRPEKPNSSAVR
jgi:hypothetical protein